MFLTEAKLLFKSRMGTLYSASALKDERTELIRCIADSDDNRINEEVKYLQTSSCCIPLYCNLDYNPYYDCLCMFIT